MFVRFNANPAGLITGGDCVINALSKTTGLPWEAIFDDLCKLAKSMYRMPSSNAVWTELAKDYGFRRYSLCPDCLTVKGFCFENPYGTFILGTGSHVIATINGDYFDLYDSGDAIPVYAFKKG